MIKLHNINKYYNKRKANKIHVVNDATLELPNNGLVTLFGPSGSGKTTLLNVISGLDKVDSGTIEFQDHLIKRYKSNTWDKIRNQHIGYIFQNYNLLNNLTVFDNIALTLHMIGVTDQNEVTNRIEYVLDKVGLKNFMKRKTSQLSGGQQQRVAIARALAKNPSVIIADEPTGNLDNKNTIAIMDIIKKISEDKLVVLVTHDRSIADYYSTQIIELEDGKIISNKLNSANGSIKLKGTSDIYLNDLTNHMSETKTDNKVSIYSDQKSSPSLDVNLILKNGTLYVDVPKGTYNKVQVLDSSSDVTVIEGSFTDELDDNKIESFDLNSVIDSNYVPKKKSIITFKEAITLSIERFKRTRKKRRAIYIGFFMSALLLAIAISMISSVYNMDESKFLTNHKDVLEINKADLTYEDLLLIEQNDSVHSVYFYHPMSIKVVIPHLYQSDDYTLSLQGIAIPYELANEEDLLLGRMPENEFEIILNKDLADVILEDYTYINVGIESYKDLINVNYSYTLKGVEEDYEGTLHIVGIIDDHNPVMYAHSDVITMLSTRIAPYELFENEITIVEGEVPVNKLDLMLMFDPDETTNLENLTYIFDYQEIVHPVTGTFDGVDEVPSIISTSSLIKEEYFDKYITYASDKIYIIAYDKSQAQSFLLENEIQSTSIYDEQYQSYRESRITESLGTIMFTILVLVSSGISYYFILKSAMISRIYEVSVYRSLGVLKRDIYKIFFVDVMIITTLTSLVGYILSTALLLQVERVDATFSDLIYVRVESLLAGILLLYIANVISGLLPLVGLLRSTPAQISNKYDL